VRRYSWLSGLCLLGLFLVIVLSALNESRHWIGAHWFCLLGFWLGVGHACFRHHYLLHRWISTNAPEKL